jgi:hypothetical protein
VLPFLTQNPLRSSPITMHVLSCPPPPSLPPLFISYILFYFKCNQYLINMCVVCDFRRIFREKKQVLKFSLVAHGRLLTDIVTTCNGLNTLLLWLTLSLSLARLLLLLTAAKGPSKKGVEKIAVTEESVRLD